MVSDPRSGSTLGSGLESGVLSLKSTQTGYSIVNKSSVLLLLSLLLFVCLFVYFVRLTHRPDITVMVD